MNKLQTKLVGRKVSKLMVLLLMLHGSAVLAQQVEKIKTSIQKMARMQDFKHSTIGFCLLDATTGQVLVEYNRESSLLPASTLKLITTACAWDKLGGAFSFKTFIYRTGNIEKDGTLNGDIIIKGSGDPSLGSARFGEKYSLESTFSKILSSITTAGISKVSGSIYADASVFEEELVPPTWIWLDMGNYFGAGASGLTINENIYQLVFKPGKKVGDSAKVLRTDPETKLVFKNNVTTTGPDTRDMAYITGAFYSDYRAVSGTIPMGKEEFKIKGSLSDPPQFVADELNARLKQIGIKVEGASFSTRIRKYSTASMVKLDSLVSPSLADIIAQTNLKSVNLFAEHLLKQLGLKANGMGSTYQGLKVVEKFVIDKTGNSAGTYLADGSGLALNNLIPAHKMTELLFKFKSEKWFDGWMKSIPVAGKSGTVSSFCKGTSAEGRIFLKSGTMQRVKSYAGYVKGKNGSLYPFAIFINNYFVGAGDIGKHLENVMVEMAELP